MRTIIGTMALTQSSKRHVVASGASRLGGFRIPVLAVAIMVVFGFQFSIPDMVGGSFLLLAAGTWTLVLFSPRVKAWVCRYLPTVPRALGYIPPATSALPGSPAPLSAEEIRALVEDKWNPEVTGFCATAEMFWETVRDQYGEHGSPGGERSVRSNLDVRVRAAAWPDELTEDGDAMDWVGTDLPAEVSGEFLRRFCERLYERDGNRPFDAHRRQMAETIRVWWSRANLATDRTFESWLGGTLGAVHLPTVKLLWYVEIEKAKSLQNPNPQYGRYVFMRAVLAAALPDEQTGVPLVGQPEPWPDPPPALPYTVEFETSRHVARGRTLSSLRVKNINAPNVQFAAQIRSNRNVLVGFWEYAKGPTARILVGHEDSLICAAHDVNFQFADQAESGLAFDQGGQMGVRTLINWIQAWAVHEDGSKTDLMDPGREEAVTVTISTDPAVGQPWVGELMVSAFGCRLLTDDEGVEA